MQQDKDEAVRSTNDDAAFSRYSAVAAGYVKDPFIKHFVRDPPRRAPLINRGTYCRLTGVKSILTQFIDKTPQLGETQVVSLGAGYDTLYFVLKSEGKAASRYYEIDFPEITGSKAMAVSRKRVFRSLLGDEIKAENGGQDLSSKDYFLLSGDLRMFESKIMPKLLEHGFKLDVPTLFLSECVLIYLDSVHSNAIFDWVTNNMKGSCSSFLTYEQINPSDRFGQMMIQNLKSRNIELKGLEACPTMEAQKQRYLTRGWDSAQVMDISTYHRERVDQAEKTRLSRLEMLDEWEEFELLSQHYCFTFAYIASDPSHGQIISDISL